MASGNKSRDFVIHAVGRERAGSPGWEKHPELRTQHPGPDVGDGGGADAEAKLGNRLCQCTLFTRDFSGFPKRGLVGCHSYEVEWLKTLPKVPPHIKTCWRITVCLCTYKYVRL